MKTESLAHMSGRVIPFDAIGQRLGADLSMGKCIMRITEAPADQTPLRTASGCATDVTTTSTTEPSTERSSTKRSKRAHFVTSATPLIEGVSADVLCGRVIEKTQFIFQVDLENKEPIPTFAVCRDCFRELAICSKAGIMRRYVYAVVMQQDLREREGAA